MALFASTLHVWTHLILNNPLTAFTIKPIVQMRKLRPRMIRYFA